MFCFRYCGNRFPIAHLKLAIHTLCLLCVLHAVMAAQSAKKEELPERERNEILQRQKWFRRGRAARTGPAAALLRRAYQQKLQSRLRRSSKLSAAVVNPTGWTPLGPAPLSSNATGANQDQDYGAVSGRVTALALDPNDSTGNTLYAGGAYGGVWKSTNAAAADPNAVTWKSLTDSQPTLATGAIAVQPGNSQLILVGTGEPNLSTDSYYGLGILRSTNGGSSWNLITTADSNTRPFAGLGFSKIVFSQDNSNVVIAATSNFTFFPSTPNSAVQGLYWSNDSGATWHYAAVSDGPSPTHQQAVTDVAYSPVTHKFYAAMAWHGVYSSNDGATWTRLPNQPGGTVLNTTACPPAGSLSCPILRGQIAIRLGSTLEMYVWYISGDLDTGAFTDRGIWKTTDDGISWVVLAEGGIVNCGDSYGCGASTQGWYDLALAAVPNGTATDVYAGAINLYKCTVSSLNPTCSNPGFINLTHVYGCNPVGSLAHLHPDQHAIVLTLAGGRSELFLGTDGGVYRALDGYSLRSGSCTDPENPFDNLNTNLGSLTQFVWFSQHPTDPGTLLGGTQDNGSPASDAPHSGSNGTSWISVNGGDGGFNQINPNDPTQWFTANSCVSIQSCNSGINCIAQSFITVVSSDVVGGDEGPFYTPYLLDPGSSSRMVVGTCRVWLGNSDGSGFFSSSNNFDTDSDSPCSSNQPNVISALAVGGTPVSDSGSPVIYAGTAAGRVFVSLDASSGPASWNERSPGIASYTISTLALDPQDPSGHTAYAAVMGFGVPHVWKTTTSGQSWSDVTGDLPDAPADSVLVDPENSNVLYLGTDVGVFMSSNGGVNWTEMGPATGSGMLPNVPVVRLAMFRSASLKSLRAATHGRGVWEYVLRAPAPDYSVSVSNPSLFAFPGQSGSFNGLLTSENAYGGTVTISCDAGGNPLPATCVPTTVTPTRAGAAYSIVAGNGSVADFMFNLKSVGSDGNSTTHATPVTMHVVDFGLGAPSPTGISVNRGSASASVRLLVTADGAFNASVSLSCQGLPTGANCSFSPSNNVTPRQALPVSLSLTIHTSATTPAGTSSVTISANSVGAPAAKTQTFSLIVTMNPDYNVTLQSPAAATYPGGTSTAVLRLAPVNSYQRAVNIACAAAAIAGATCSASPSSVNLAAGSGTVSLAMKIPGSASAGTYPILVNTSDVSGTPAHQFTLNLTVVPDFAIVGIPATQTVTAGQTASYKIQLTGVGGPYNNSVALACSGAPPLGSCSFSLLTVTPGDLINVTLAIKTGAALALRQQLKKSSPLYALLLPLLALACAKLVDKGGNERKRAFFLIAVLIAVAGLFACGGGGGVQETSISSPANGTPTGNYTITVTATSGSLSHSTKITLIVQ